MDNINFKKVLDDGELFDQQANYEENFEKINQLVVPKITDLETNKVDKVAGKGLSTNDYTTTEKNKLAGIPADTAAQLAEKALKTEVGTLASLLTTAKTSIVAAINELFNNKANKAQEAWITPTLLNGWISTDPTNYPVQYYKDNMGVVRFRGRIHGGATGSSPFAVPTGYRPSKAFTSIVSDISGATRACAVNTVGNVIIYFSTYATYLNLDSVSFRAEA